MATKKAKPPALPKVTTRDPSLPASLPTTSKTKTLDRTSFDEEEQLPLRKRFGNFLYNRENKTFCSRTCESWFYIILYSIMYLIFLLSYTMAFMYGALWMVRLTTDYKQFDLLAYADFAVGLSASPTSESNQPLIWYRVNQYEDYDKYIKAIDSLLAKKRRKREVNELGPCGETPFGYGEKPCIVLRVNKNFHWSGQPLQANSTEAEVAPVQVREWMKRDKKLWLHCEGYYPYDKEHIGSIRYYPDPPGFDPALFPAKANTDPPLAAIQISGFTFDVAIAIECKLWYMKGPSSTNFILYVSDDRPSNRSIV